MQMLSRNPAEAYRRVELDARIAASRGADLTRICLEHAVTALGQALSSLERDRSRSVAEPLTRARGIVLWLAGGVSPDNPLRDQLRQFYGGLAALIGTNIRHPVPAQIDSVRTDLADLLAAALAD